MIALTKKEIIAGLKKLGIKTRSELKTYLREYKAYYTRYNMNSITTKSSNQ